MGLEPMTSPLPRECSTTELHQPSSLFRSSSRARILAITTRNANSPKNKIGSHRTWTSRSSNPTYRLENPCTWITAVGSIVNHASKPKTTKPPSAANILPRSAAGLSDCSISLTPLTTRYSLLTTNYSLKNGAQGRIRTSVAQSAADLQSAAINHSATCALCHASRPSRNSIYRPCRISHDRSRANTSAGLWMANAARLEQLAGTTNINDNKLHLLLPQKIWSWRRDLNPRPPDYKSGALPAELRQPKARPEQAVFA